MRALLLLLAMSCAATTSNVSSSTSAAEHEILEIERAWGDAEVHRDATALDAILDSRFVFTFGSEPPVDKKTVMKNVLSADNPLPSTPSEQRVLIDGDVAIATGVDTQVPDGKAMKKAYRSTTTFVRRDGQWRAIAVHMVAVPP